MFGYLIDMDGVIYRDNQLIPGADGSSNSFNDDNVPFMFLTNNSQRTRRDVADEAPPHGHRRRRGARLHLRDGDRPLPRRRRSRTAPPTSSARAGCSPRCTRTATRSSTSDPDYVVVGEGRTLTFECSRRRCK